jgi:cation-transporting ATPase 13A2
MNFKLGRELNLFLYFMIIFYTASLVVYCFNENNYLKIQYGEEYYKDFQKMKKLFNLIILRMVSLLTVVIPPSLYICIRYTSFYFTEMLYKNNITCLSEKRLNAAGKVNTIVLDKTGTLTEDGIDIFGFQSTRRISGDTENDEVSSFEFDDIHKDLKTYSSMHMEFWSRFASNEKKSKVENSNFYDYKTDLKNNPIFFIECLASCLSIDKLQNKILGNNIDKKIFEYLDWNLDKIKEKFAEFEIEYVLSPTHNYLIMEELVFKKTNLNKIIPQYLLKIIKKFEFSSKYQSNSVLINNELDGSFRYFIKGAPEKIKNICLENSLPNNFDKVLEKHSKKGLRVLACATKVLSKDVILNNLNEIENDMENEKNFRQTFEKDLFFLGFIILSNKLKPITKKIINALNESNSNIIMATGDNPFTSISVANECEMINSENKICLIDLDKANHKIYT